MFEENEPGNITPGLYADAEMPKPAEPVSPVEGLVPPAEGSFHDAREVVENPVYDLEMTWPAKERAAVQAPEWAESQAKMVESDPNAPVASDELVGVGEVASKDLIGDAQTPAETSKPVEEPESTVPYHSMDPAMSDASFNIEAPTLNVVSESSQQPVEPIAPSANVDTEKLWGATDAWRKEDEAPKNLENAA